MVTNCEICGDLFSTERGVCEDCISLYRLEELVVADKDDRLFISPVAIGQKVFKVGKTTIYDYQVKGFRVLADKQVIFYTDGLDFTLRRIGETIFISRAEAEAALAARKDGLDID